MQIEMIGISYQTAGVDLRERLALHGKRLGEAFALLRERCPGWELVIVSTCSRTEFYFAALRESLPLDVVITAVSELCRVEEEQFRRACVTLENETAVGHLFRVAAGLDSMVPGEPQVLGQVKRAV